MTRDELAALGVAVPEAAFERLRGFVDALLDENRRTNLTGARTAEVLWRVHVCDCLAALPLLPSAGAARLLDLGSGGGLPGVPLACVRSELSVTLLDATRKKVAAVERIASRVGLNNVRVLWGRAETVAHDAACRERFDVVTARAVAKLAALAELASGFVRPGGECWFFKSDPGVAEREEAESAARRCQLEFVRSHDYRLIGEKDERHILIYRKSAPLPVALPRGVGRTRKRAL